VFRRKKKPSGFNGSAGITRLKAVRLKRNEGRDLE